MININNSSKFLLHTFISQTIICFLVVIFNILISVIVKHFISVDTVVGSIDSIVFIWIFILGLSNFKYSLKFLLSMGVLRRKIFISIAVASKITALVWALLTILLSRVGGSITSITIIYDIIFKEFTFLSSLVWNFTLLLLLFYLGNMIVLIYYRSGKKTRLLVSVSPFLLYGIMSLINHAYQGRLFNTFSRFFFASMGFAEGILSEMGFSGAVGNPFIGGLTFAICTIVICFMTFLLLRKAPIKD